MNFKVDDRVKLTLTEKLTIDDTTRSINMWISYDPVKLDNYLIKNPKYFLNPHGQLTLKKTLNEIKKRNSKGSS